ncbi:hypothetical protein JCM14076_16610 [Methylosoma difficile]
MSTDVHIELCALCSQKVEIKGFSLVGNSGVHHFCCGGCLSIFQLLYPDSPQNQQLKQNEENPK